jgi:hypothetical protein
MESTMAQYYSTPERESSPTAEPNVEVFYVSRMECNYNLQNMDHADEYTITEPGFYYWYCFPGCLPDSEPIGPFNTEAEAVKNMMENNGEE